MWEGNHNILLYLSEFQFVYFYDFLIAICLFEIFIFIFVILINFYHTKIENFTLSASS